jgi:hypothetical protein
MEDGSIFGRHIGGIENILDPDRNTVERTEIPSILAQAIRPARPFECVLWIQERPGLDGLIRFGDPRQGSANQLLGRDITLSNEPCRFDRCECVESQGLLL